jgi:hypothetical protein
MLAPKLYQAICNTEVEVKTISETCSASIIRDFNVYDGDSRFPKC